MRVLFDRLEALGRRWFVTGSVAASVHGRLRQTMDTDVVVDMDPRDFPELVRPWTESHAIADPVGFGDVIMASIIDMASADKVDIILGPRSGFDLSAMERRERHVIPGLGSVWVATVEDVILAKLRWSDGTSDLQIADCAHLMRINADRLDDRYLDHWASQLGLGDLLEGLRAP